MAIDYIIDYNCKPKEELGTLGILERIKSRERARQIINLYRSEGDERDPMEMGFEFTRRTPEGTEEKQLIRIADVIEETKQLDPLAHHCEGCPANRTQMPFGCIGFVQYPFSALAEAWLLEQLPVPDDALVWMLLKRGIEEFGYDGSSVTPLRQSGDQFFEQQGVMSRRLGEVSVTSDQVFEMLFLLGNVQPTHAGVLLLFFGAIDRDLTAEQIMNLTPPTDPVKNHPFLLPFKADDDRTIAELKSYLYALYLAWTLNVRVLLDA